jgi:heat-inducible transcriptional repressor
MDIPRLPHSDKGLINKSLENNVVDTDELLRLASSLLSSITHQIACVTYPKLDTGILGKIQLISLSSSRILIVITITAGLVKTITLELNTEIQERQLESVQSLLNERLSGLTLKEIRSTFRERFQDFAGGEHPVIRLFFDSAEKIFKDVRQSDNLYITGAKNVIKQPEFEDPGKFQGVIELIEDKDIIIHILDKTGEAAQNQVFISIGSENQDQKLNEYSFISKEYKLGDISGTLGIIGPKRMEYSKVVAIVDYVAKMLTEILRNESR